jgi:hypothetical protein
LAAQEKIAFIDLNARARKPSIRRAVSSLRKYYLKRHTKPLLPSQVECLPGSRRYSCHPNCGLIPFCWTSLGNISIKKKLFIIGDSTVANGPLPLPAGASPFGRCFDHSKADVINRAIGGRSSHSYMAEGTWDKVLEEVHPAILF